MYWFLDSTKNPPIQVTKLIILYNLLKINQMICGDTCVHVCESHLSWDYACETCWFLEAYILDCGYAYL